MTSQTETKEKNPYTSGILGVASIACAVASILVFGVALSLVAIIVGIVAITKKNTVDVLGGVVGLILGIIVFVGMMIWIIGG